MRTKRLIAFLLAVILCVACAATALAKPRELEPDESDAMEKRVCDILRGEGYNIDMFKNVSRVDIRYTSDGYDFSIETTDGKYYHAKFRGTKTITAIGANFGYEGVPMEKPKLDKKTMKRVEKKVNSFLKKVNPSLRKKIGKLKVFNVVKNGKTTYAEIRDSKKKVYFTLKITSSAVKVRYYTEMNKNK
jgi:hypothetical protein